MKEDGNSADILGLAPYGEALNTLVEKSLEGVGAFLGRICLPAAEEFGLLLKDRISSWRTANVVKIAEKAEGIFHKFSLPEGLHAHPRLVMKVLEEGSWGDDDDVQNMWAGLLASSCTEEGTDDSNLIFVNVLSQITRAEAAILNYGCVRCNKGVTRAGWLQVREQVTVELDELQRITSVYDVQRLDREMDHLRELGLIGGLQSGGFMPESTFADITPTPLALQMYVRCQGYRGSPVEYFGLLGSPETL